MTYDGSIFYCTALSCILDAVDGCSNNLCVDKLLSPHVIVIEIGAKYRYIDSRSKHITMKGYRTEIPLLKLKESIIVQYFDEVKDSLIKLAVCQTCSKHVVFLTDEYKQLGAEFQKDKKCPGS